MNEWQTVTSRRKGRISPIRNKWETLDKNIWYQIIDFVIGPKRDYMSSGCATFSLKEIPKEAKKTFYNGKASDREVLAALSMSLPFGKAWIQHRPVVLGKFANIYLLRCVSTRLKELVDLYNLSIGFYFQIGPVPRGGGYFTPAEYWKYWHNASCPEWCECKKEPHII